MATRIKLVNSVTGEEENIGQARAEISAKRSDIRPLELSRSGDRKLTLHSEVWMSYSMRRMLDGKFCGFLDNIELDLDTIGPGGLDEGTMVDGDICHIFGVESPSVANNLVLIASKNKNRPKGFANAVYQGAVPLGTGNKLIKFSHAGAFFEMHEQKVVDKSDGGFGSDSINWIDVSAYVPETAFDVHLMVVGRAKRGRVDFFVEGSRKPRRTLYMMGTGYSEKAVVIPMPGEGKQFGRKIWDVSGGISYSATLDGWTDGRLM